MNKLTEFLQERDGSFSATRLAFLAWAFGVLAVWIANAVTRPASEKLPTIDGSVITILGILMTGKVAQKPFEKDALEAPDPKPSPTPPEPHPTPNPPTPES